MGKAFFLDELHLNAIVILLGFHNSVAVLGHVDLTIIILGSNSR